MDSKDIHRAMRLKLPIICEGRRYERITEAISWYDDSGKNRLSCGLIAKNFYIRVPADKVDLADGEPVQHPEFRK